MAFISEDSIRKKADEATIKFLDLWEELSNSVLGTSLPVCIKDLKKNPLYKHITYEFSTAIPDPVEKPVSLAIWTSHYPHLSNVLITHEIGHWILVLKGFKTIREGRLDRVKNAFIRSMIDHPVIYSLQRKYGHDPLEWVDKRAIDSIHYVQKQAVSWPHSINLMALYLADDVFNCSKRVSKRILRLSRRYHPKLHEKIVTITNCMNKFDLNNPEENLQCRYEIVSELGLKGKWVIKDDLTDLLNRIKKD